MSNLAIVFLICLTILSFLFSSKNHSTPIAKLSLTYNEIKNEEVETDWKSNLRNLTTASEIFYQYPNFLMVGIPTNHSIISVGKDTIAVRKIFMRCHTILFHLVFQDFRHIILLALLLIHFLIHC